MHPADIQAALKKKGITQYSIAKECGVNVMTISRVINYKGVSNRLMIAISQKIGIDHHIVFSEYYDNRTPRSLKRAANY